MVDRAVNDPFLETFFSRVPREAPATFTDQQLLWIKTAFAGQHRGAHTVDLRFTLPFPRRLYVVFLLGPERRRRPQRQREPRPLTAAGNLLTMLLFAALLLTAAIGALYLLKSALGIDLFPHVSLGIWGALKNQFRLLAK